MRTKKYIGLLIVSIMTMVACNPMAVRGQPSKIISPAADQMAVTIYRDNLAFITETRMVELPAGRSTIAFEGVSDLMIPQTAILREFGALTLERNFDFDLLSQGSLFKNAVGKTVFLTRTNPATGKLMEEEATIISAGNGVVMDIDGRIETFECSGLPEKISFSEIPEELLAEPTLSLEVTAETAGPQELTISYLASGFEWQADYILRLKEDSKTADLTGWLTVTNGTNQSIKDAPTAIVAGELQRLYETRAKGFYADGFFASCWPRGSTKTGISRPTHTPQADKFRRIAPTTVLAGFASESLEEEDTVIVSAQKAQATREDLGDYKLFRTPEPTTVAAYQTKQVLFLDKNNVELTRFHVFDINPDDWDIYDYIDPNDNEQFEWITENNPTIRYDIDNDKDGQLAEPLPAGTVRVMDRGPNGDYFYLGGDDIRDLAVGLPVEVETGESPSVLTQTRFLDAREKELPDGDTEYSAKVEHRVTNANPYPVMVEIVLGKEYYSNTPIKANGANRPQTKDRSFPTWRFRVAPGKDAILTYRTRWVE